MFATVDGAIMPPRSISKAWERMTRRLGIKACFHAIRHHHASCLIANGIDVVTVSRRLGHGSPAITLKIYAHLMETDDRAAKVMQRADGASKMSAETSVDMLEQLLKKKRSGANSGGCQSGANFRFCSSLGFAK